ncbi:MAG: hypothetical protein ACE361_10935 [Aureliella sp.]
MKTQLALTSVMLIPCLLFALVSQAESLGLVDDDDNLVSAPSDQESASGGEPVSGSVDPFGGMGAAQLWQRSSLARIEPNQPTDSLDRCCGVFQHSELGRVEIEKDDEDNLIFRRDDEIIVFQLADLDLQLGVGSAFVSSDDRKYQIHFRGSTMPESGEWVFSELRLGVPLFEKMLTFERKRPAPKISDDAEQQPQTVSISIPY